MEYCRAQVDIGMEMTDPMDLSAMWKRKGKGDKGGKYDKGGRYGKGGKNGGDGKNNKGKARGGRARTPRANVQATWGKAKREPYDGYCTGCKKHGHKQQDCWAKAQENASGSTGTVAVGPSPSDIDSDLIAITLQLPD